ncbi:barstar family protein [Deinococcus sonorensis]|uniref:Barstar family protein n=1 Tax=Deinococcus sonorensis TaxID=309891 RepID=A0ABV8YBI2_9DEIO
MDKVTWVHVLASEREIPAHLPQVAGVVIRMSGKQMATLNETYRAFAQAFKFPDYFGFNMNALYDLLTDLAWITFESMTLVITDAEHVLCRGAAGDNEALLGVLESTGQHWATPIALNEVWDREAIDFRTLLIRGEEKCALLPLTTSV